MLQGKNAHADNRASRTAPRYTDRQTDLTGVVSMLWGLDEEEAAEILDRRFAEVAERAAEIDAKSDA